jgi:Uma2 family endonuclease
MVEMPHHRFTIEAYEEMIRHGILTEDDRVELLAGEIVNVSPIGQQHVGRVNRLTALFSAALGRRAIVQIQMPVTLPPDSAPEPDVTILRPRPDFYEGGRARPEDVLLLIEVAKSSLQFDRVIKAPVYAKAGISEYWIVDLVHETLECYCEPSNESYGSVRRLHSGDTIAPLAFPDVELRVSDIIPEQ